MFWNMVWSFQHDVFNPHNKFRGVPKNFGYRLVGFRWICFAALDTQEHHPLKLSIIGRVCYARVCFVRFWYGKVYVYEWKFMAARVVIYADAMQCAV